MKGATAMFGRARLQYDIQGTALGMWQAE